MCKFCSVKCWFIFFNALFLASGVALVTMGALHYSTYSALAAFAGKGLSDIAVGLIAAGVTIAFISLVGHVGAFINNSSMVACFICLLILMILMEIAAGAALYVFRSGASLLQVNSAINSKARGMIYEYSHESRHAIDRIQEKFSCCGADSYTDWSRSEGWRGPGAVPDSCCPPRGEGCGRHAERAHRKGCIRVIKLFLLGNLVRAAAVCLALGVAEVFGVLVGVCLCLKIKRKSYENLS